MKPKVSVITICRNENQGIKRTLESVLTQTYKSFEYLVIDGGSTDGTKEIIQKYLDQLTFFTSEPDTGIYNAMNKALQKAQGEYVIFINGGDALSSDDVLEKVFSKNEITADIVYGDLWIEEKNKTVLGVSPEKITLGYLFYSTLWHPACFIKLTLFKNYGLYDESFRIAADYDFFLKIFSKNQVSSKKVQLAISRFNTRGVGSNPDNQEVLNAERRRAQKKYFSDETVSLGIEYEELMKRFAEQNNMITTRIVKFITNRFK